MPEKRFHCLEFQQTAPVASVREERSADWHCQEAMQYEMNGLFERALRSYSAAVGDDPCSLPGWIGQMVALIELEEFPEAETWAVKALERFPDNPDVLATRALAMYHQGNLREAREMHDQAFKRRGASEIVWHARGVIHMRSNLSVADACFDRAVEAAALPPLQSIRASEALSRARNPVYALRHLNTAAAYSADAARLHYAYGLAYEGLHHWKPARKSYALAAQMAPTNHQYARCRNRLSGFSLWRWLRKPLGRSGQ